MVSIGLTGAGGTGKSTFAKFLKDIHNFRVIEDYARTWVNSYRKGEYINLDYLDNAEMQLAILNDFRRANLDGDVVFDRTPLEILVYAERLQHQALDMSEIRRNVSELCKNIELIVFFPFRSEFNLEDKFRVTEVLHQISISSKIFLTLEEFFSTDKIRIYRHDLSMEANLAEILANHNEARDVSVRDR